MTEHCKDVTVGEKNEGGRERHDSCSMMKLYLQQFHIIRKVPIQ